MAFLVASCATAMRHAATLLVLAADEVTRALRRDEDDVEVLAGLDLLEVDVEAVSEQQRGARGEIFLDLGVHRRLGQVRCQDGDERCTLDGVGGSGDPEAVLLRLLPTVAALAHADDDVEAAFFQVQRVGAALAAIADHGDCGALEGFAVDIFLRVNTHGCSS